MIIHYYKLQQITEDNLIKEIESIADNMPLMRLKFYNNILENHKE